MTARCLGPGVVLVEAEHIAVLRYAVATAVREKRRVGMAPSPALVELHQAAEHAYRQAMSLTRHDDTPPAPVEQPSTWIDTDQAARILGVTRRQAQRLARTLDARRVGQAWTFDPDRVHEYQRKKRNNGC